MGFKEDLKSGEDVEMEILSVLQKEFPEAHKPTDKKTREFYDIIVPIEEGKEIWLEIKNDKYVSKNMAFECLGRNGKNSGILKTKSDYWIQYRKFKFYIWNTIRLKKYLLNIGGCLKNCGDDKATCAWIIPEEKILSECIPDGIFEKNDKLFLKFFKK